MVKGGKVKELGETILGFLCIPVLVILIFLIWIIAVVKKEGGKSES